MSAAEKAAEVHPIIGRFEMVNDEDVRKLASAIRRAVGEHGQPNSFGSDELEQVYCGPAKRRIQKIGRSSFGRAELYKALGGREGWGSAPTYNKGRFYV